MNYRYAAFVSVILAVIGYYYIFLQFLPDNTSIYSARDKDKTQIYRIQNESTYLYSAYIVEDLIDATQHVFSQVKNKTMVVIAWQSGFLAKQTVKCCILEKGNGIIISNVTNTHHCCYYSGPLLARRVECPISHTSKDIIGVSLVVFNGSCSTDKERYITPITLSPAFGKNKLAMCNKHLYGSLHAKQLIEWFEIHRFFGVDNFTIHQDQTLNTVSRQVLKYYQETERIANVLDFDIPDAAYPPEDRGDTNYRHQLGNDEHIALFDCKERHRYFDFVADIDSDEFLVTNDITENAFKTILANKFREQAVGVLSFYVSVHIKSWTPTNASHPMLIGKYEDATDPFDDRTKNMYMPSRIHIEQGMIHIVKPKLGYTRLFVNPTQATLHHFRDCRKEWLHKFTANMYREGQWKEVITKCDLFHKIRSNSLKILSNVRKIENRILNVYKALNFGQEVDQMRQT